MYSISAHVWCLLVGLAGLMGLVKGGMEGCDVIRNGGFIHEKVSDCSAGRSRNSAIKILNML